MLLKERQRCRLDSKQPVAADTHIARTATRKADRASDFNDRRGQMGRRRSAQYLPLFLMAALLTASPVRAQTPPPSPPLSTIACDVSGHSHVFSCIFLFHLIMWVLMLLRCLLFWGETVCFFPRDPWRSSGNETHSSRRRRNASVTASTHNPRAAVARKPPAARPCAAPGRYTYKDSTV